MNERYVKYRESYLKYYRKYKKLHPDRIKQSRDKLLFDGLREKVIIRDQGKCLNCGMTQKQSKQKWGKDLDVNHINGYGVLVSKDRRDNSIDNLETLCRSCHTIKDIKLRKEKGIYKSAIDYIDPRKNPRFFNRWSNQWEYRS